MGKFKVYFNMILIVITLVSISIEEALGITVILQNGTATYTQKLSDCSSHSPDLSVDGDFNNEGWAIAKSCDYPGDTSFSEIAVWETETDTNATQLDFFIHQNFSFSRHLIGRLRFSVTSEDRSTFADDLDNGGDVTANWNVLEDPLVSGPSGMTFTVLGDNSILVGGTISRTGTYNIQYTGSFYSITGLRLEVFEDPSLPFNGPGLMPSNGNFVLSELEVIASGTPPTVTPTATPASTFTSTLSVPVSDMPGKIILFLIIFIIITRSIFKIFRQYENWS